MYTIEEGDLLRMVNDDSDNTFDVIVHGCNCFHTMGAGIARQIKAMFPQAYFADKATEIGDPFKLGTYSHARCFTQTGRIITVVNAYTQFFTGSDARYAALETAFKLIAMHFPDKHIAYPEIGCGIGGLIWSKTDKIINQALDDCNHTLIVYKPPVKYKANEEKEYDDWF